MYCSYWNLLNFDTYQDEIDNIIIHSVKWSDELNEYITGDTDTNAAIAGSLLGV